MIMKNGSCNTDSIIENDMDGFHKGVNLKGY